MRHHQLPAGWVESILDPIVHLLITQVPESSLVDARHDGCRSSSIRESSQCRAARLAPAQMGIHRDQLTKSKRAIPVSLKLLFVEMFGHGGYLPSPFEGATRAAKLPAKIKKATKIISHQLRHPSSPDQNLKHTHVKGLNVHFAYPRR
jgi:hypothetical protein